MEKNIIEKMILDMMMSQTFASWYEKDFLDFAQGETNAKSKTEIKKDILEMLPPLIEANPGKLKNLRPEFFENDNPNQ